MNEREKCPNCGANDKSHRLLVAWGGTSDFAPNVLYDPCQNPWHDASQPAAEPLKEEIRKAMIGDPEHPFRGAVQQIEWTGNGPGAEPIPPTKDFWNNPSPTKDDLVDAYNEGVTKGYQTALADSEIRAEFTRRKATLEEEYGKEVLTAELDYSDSTDTEEAAFDAWFNAGPFGNCDGYIYERMKKAWLARAVQSGEQNMRARGWYEAVVRVLEMLK